MLLAGANCLRAVTVTEHCDALGTVLANGTKSVGWNFLTCEVAATANGTAGFDFNDNAHFTYPDYWSGDAIMYYWNGLAFVGPNSYYNSADSPDGTVGWFDGNSSRLSFTWNPGVGVVIHLGGGRLVRATSS